MSSRTPPPHPSPAGAEEGATTPAAAKAREGQGGGVDAARPITILIAAMGGEGGGVLAGWITAAAVAAGLPVQRTSIPGVAQRTGATTYYLEIVPTPWAELGGRRPVLSLNPAPGNVDLLVATELLEAARAIHSGLVTPDRTLLIASTHRVFTIGEKSEMADGRFDAGRAFEAARRLARHSVLFDMAAVAAEARCHVNAVLMGAIAASGRLPIAPEGFLVAIRGEGKAVEANLRGFEAGIRAVQAGAAAETAAQARRPAAARARAELQRRIEAEFPAPCHDILAEGTARMTDYQDARYAARYLDRLAPIRDLDGGDHRLTREAGRHLALWMSFEDLIRVAQLKTRPERQQRLRAEIRAAPDAPVVVTEFLKPGVEEFASVLPPALARRLLAWVDRRGWRARFDRPMKVRTSSITGFVKLRALAALRRWRPRTWRFAEEQACIERWLDLVVRAARQDRALAVEIAECARLIKGYGETHRRGLANFERIVEAVIEPALEGRLAASMAVDAVTQARLAALADPEGDRLADTLAAIDAARSAERAAAE